MRPDLGKVDSPAALADFAQKVAKLKADGLRPFEVAQRLGIPRTTMNERLRRYRESRGSR